MASSQAPAFETIVRKLFGTHRVVFSHKGKERFEENQKIYLYSGEKFIGTGQVCSIYSDENYTCEVPKEVYKSLKVGDTVSNLPPEEYGEEAKKWRESTRKTETERKLGDRGKGIFVEGKGSSSSPRSEASSGTQAWQGLVREADELVSRGDSLAIVVAEEKYIKALKVAEESGAIVRYPVKALVIFYLDQNRCEDSRELFGRYLEEVTADTLIDEFGETISEINLRANELIYWRELDCAEHMLTKLASALAKRQSDKKEAILLIRVYNRLAYLYSEWGLETKAEEYEKRIQEISDRHDIDIVSGGSE
jgi:hypothetical protein